MAKQMPLLAEISNCLTAYNETLERIIEGIVNSFDTNQRRHDSPIIMQVQDLLSIDAELKRHLTRMEQWTKRQNEIEENEKKLNSLSTRVHNFAKILSTAQSNIQGCLSTAQKIQSDLSNQEISTLELILDTAKSLSNTNNSMPSVIEWGQSILLKDLKEIPTPNINKSKSTEFRDVSD